MTQRNGVARPICHLLAVNFECIEEGIVGPVKALVKHGFYPVWSCEGYHREADWVRSMLCHVEGFAPKIRRRPYLLLVGPRAAATKDALYLACSSLLRDGFGPLAAYLVDLRNGKVPRPPIAPDDVSQLRARVRRVGVPSRLLGLIVFSDRSACKPGPTTIVAGG